MTSLKVTVLGAVLTSLVLLGGQARAAVSDAKVKASVQKGLKWLKSQGERSGDGIRWKSVGYNNQPRFTVALTSLAGMAFLMEGSTLREGPYSREIRGAAEYVLSKAQPSGLIGVTGLDESDSERYMFGHGYAMLFLASLVGDEDSPKRREKLADVLEKAAKYSRDAQTKRGGWGYRSAKEDEGFDEGTMTCVQMQGLRAIRNAGLAVPTVAITDGIKYLKASTRSDGGVAYSLMGQQGVNGPGIAASSIVSGYSSGQYDSPLVKQWLGFMKKHPPSSVDIDPVYSKYYYAQAAYMLGEDRYAKLFPNAKDRDRLTWSGFKKDYFAGILSAQESDGSWEVRGFGAKMAGKVYVATFYLGILQLERGVLPIYQR